MDKYKDYVKARIMPTPQAIEVKEGSFALKDGCKVCLHANFDWTADIVKVFAASWNAKPEVTFIQKELPLVADGYGLTVEKDSCTISASSRGGVFNALNAMRQLEEAERGVMKASYWQIPCVEINDFPAMAFRGMHICWFPETPAYEIEKLIRLAAITRTFGVTHHVFGGAVVVVSRLHFRGVDVVDAASVPYGIGAFQ